MNRFAAQSEEHTAQSEEHRAQSEEHRAQSEKEVHHGFHGLARINRFLKKVSIN